MRYVVITPTRRFWKLVVLMQKLLLVFVVMLAVD